jgi:energy-coupling factor transporter transmembrane protein EcfT
MLATGRFAIIAYCDIMTAIMHILLPSLALAIPMLFLALKKPRFGIIIFSLSYVVLLVATIQDRDWLLGVPLLLFTLAWLSNKTLRPYWALSRKDETKLLPKSKQTLRGSKVSATRKTTR